MAIDKVPAKSYEKISGETRILTDEELAILPETREALKEVVDKIGELRGRCRELLPASADKVDEEIICPLEERMIAVAGPIRCAVMTTRKALEEQVGDVEKLLEEEVFQDADSRVKVQAELGKLTRAVLANAKNLNDKNGINQYSRKVIEASETAMQTLTPQDKVKSGFAKCLKEIKALSTKLQELGESEDGKPRVDKGYNIKNKAQTQISVLPAAIIREGSETPMWEPEPMQEVLLLQEVLEIIETLESAKALKKDKAHSKAYWCLEKLKKLGRQGGIGAIDAIDAMIGIDSIDLKDEDKSLTALKKAAKAASTASFNKTAPGTGTPLQGERLAEVHERERHWQKTGKKVLKEFDKIERIIRSVAKIETAIQDIQRMTVDTTAMGVIREIIRGKQKLEQLGASINPHNSINVDNLGELVGRVFVKEERPRPEADPSQAP